jgi:hypothetical protein
MEAQGQPAIRFAAVAEDDRFIHRAFALGHAADDAEGAVGTVAVMATDPRTSCSWRSRFRAMRPRLNPHGRERLALRAPDYSSYLQGALIASTYPLYSDISAGAMDSRGSERREFANGSAKASTTNHRPPELQELRRGPDSAIPVHRFYAAGEAPPRSSSTGRPDGLLARLHAAGLDQRRRRRGTWPVQAYKVPSTGYVLSIKFADASAPPSLATFPSPYFHAIFLILTAAVLVGWPERDRQRGAARALHLRMAALVSGSRPDRGGLSGRCRRQRAVMWTVLAAIYLTRATLHVRKWEWSWIGNIAAAALVAWCCRARRSHPPV